jgi:hypothetical protein
MYPIDIQLISKYDILMISLDIQKISIQDILLISNCYLIAYPRMISNRNPHISNRYPCVSQAIHPIFIFPVWPSCHSSWDRSNYVHPSWLPFWQQTCPSLASWDHFRPCETPAPAGAVAVSHCLYHGLNFRRINKQRFPGRFFSRDRSHPM